METRTMTQEQLDQHVREIVAPMIKEIVGSEVADVVKEALEKSRQPMDMPQSNGIESPSDVLKRYDPGIPFGKVVRAMAAAKSYGEGPTFALNVLRQWGEGHLAEVLESAREKAMSAGTPTSGGFLVPEQFSQDVIDLLRPASVVRKLNPVIMPMPTGTVRVPKITSGSSGSYIGENTNIPKSEVQTGQITLTWKKLAVLVPISNDLLRYSSPGADAIVRDDMVRGLASRENQAFIRDDGTSSTPKGLRYWAPAANVIAANSTVNLANVTTDLGKLILQLKNNNVPMTRPAWIMAPRTEHYLATVQNANGYFVFREEILNGRLWGFPIGVTTQVPTNLADGGNTDESELYLVDMADAVIGEAQRLIVDASNEAAYHDGSSVVSAYSQDQTVIRAVSEHDFAMRRDVSVAVLNQVRWGA